MKSLRPWATPLTVATTLVTIVTGVLLFFHLSPGLTRLSHEWIGMLMLLGVAAHMVINWRAFTTYFKRPVGLGLIAAGVLATALTFVISPAENGKGGGSPVGMVMGALEGADMETLAALAKTDVPTVIEKLSAAGITAEAGQTLREATGGNRGQNMQAMQAILGGS